jgi:integrase
MIYRQTGRETWQARIWVAGKGKCRSVSTGTSDRAKALKFEALLRQAANGNIRRDLVAAALDDLTGTKATPLPLAEIFNTNNRAGYFQGKHDRAHWRGFATWAESLGITDASRITRPLVQQYLATLAGMAQKTVANVRNNLRSIWGRANIPGDNPFAGRFNIEGTESERGRAFTDAEVSAILAQCHGDQVGAVLCGLYTGLRYSDVLALQWKDIADGFIHITPSKTKRHGVEVVLPVHRKLAAWLDQAPHTGALIFPETAAAQKSSVNRAWFSGVLARAGIDVHRGGLATFHSLRHTFVSNLSRSGVSQAVAMRLAGHTNQATSLRYTHDVESLRAAVDGLG